MIVVLCEIITDEAIDKYIDLDRCEFKEGVDLIPLTPQACFQLEQLGIDDYSIPDDYAIPKEVDLEMLFDDLKEISTFSVFLVNIAHNQRSFYYWRDFLNNYMNKKEPETVYFYLDKSKMLRGVLDAYQRNTEKLYSEFSNETFEKI